MTAFLPNVDWTSTASGTPVPPRETLNNSATPAREVQLSVAADNAPLRIIYGQCRLGPMIACVLSYQGDLVILAVWGHGEVDSFVDLQIDDKALAAGVSYTHYTGTVGQTVNALLVSAFAAQTPPVTYTDALPGICYSVVRVPAGSSTGFPRLNAVIKGLKVWTGAAAVWSDNPAYCLSDFITNSTYGMGRTTNWASVASVAADCNALVGVAPNQEKLRTLNLVMDTIQPCAQWLDTLRAYACCWITQSGPDLKLISDKAGASVATYDHASGNIQSIAGTKKRGTQSTPTVMTVTYTDTTVMPYRDATAVAYAPGVLAGTTPRRESQVSLPGITRYSQAYREAIERLNKLLLNDLSLTLGVFDEGLSVEIADIVTVTHPIGFASKLLRVKNVTGEYGRYSLALEEYDPAVYSAVVSSAPTWVDTNLPSPTAPPALTGLVVSEEVYQQQDGTYSSRIRVTWTAATYAFLKYYRVEVRNSAGLALIDSVSLDQSAAPTYASPAIQEGVNYTVKVQTVSTIGAAGAWSTSTIAALGKQLIPSSVSAVTGFEVGGEVRLSWAAAVDIDIWKYEVRYGTVGVTWAASTLIDRFDGLRCITNDIPTGTWDFLVKAVDSVGNYSATEARIALTVTLDSASFFVGSHSYATPTLTNATQYALGRTDAVARYVTDDGVPFATKFPSAINTYANLLQTANASTWLSETYDFGITLSGNWVATSSGIAAVGSITQYLELSTNGTTWAQYPEMVAKAIARFARVRITAASGSALVATIPAVSVRIDVLALTESGNTTTLASGPTRISLANVYTYAKTVQITPKGTTALTVVYDNVLVGDQRYTSEDYFGGDYVSTAANGFDAYCFNSAGTQVIADIFWNFEGV